MSPKAQSTISSYNRTREPSSQIPVKDVQSSACGFPQDLAKTNDATLHLTYTVLYCRFQARSDPLGTVTDTVCTYSRLLHSFHGKRGEEIVIRDIFGQNRLLSISWALDVVSRSPLSQMGIHFNATHSIMRNVFSPPFQDTPLQRVQTAAAGGKDKLDILEKSRHH